MWNDQRLVGSFPSDNHCRLTGQMVALVSCLWRHGCGDVSGLHDNLFDSMPPALRIYHVGRGNTRSGRS